MPPLCLDLDAEPTPLPLLRHFLRVAWEYADGSLYIPVAQANHWTLLTATVHANGLHWRHMDGLGVAPSEQHCRLAQQLSTMLEEPFVDLQSVRHIHQVSAHTCGTVLLAHASWQLGLPCHYTPQLIDQIHDKLIKHGSGTGFLGSGPTAKDCQQHLVALLIEKGVPEDKSEERAKEITHKFGQQNTLTALQASNPWQALKAEASKPGKNIRFLSKEEQQAFIDKRAQEKFGAEQKDRPRKKPHKVPTKPIELTLDATQIELLRGHFTDPDAEAVLSDIQADGTGIAVASKLDASRFIQAGKHLSTQAMALLVPEELSPEFIGSADASMVHFAAIYRPTNDPLIIHGTLIQLGDSPVEHQPPQAPDLGITPPGTGVLKIVA